jgi:hypothetical protein
MQDLNEKRAVITCDSQGWAEYGGLFERVLEARLNRMKELAEGSK